MFFRFQLECYSPKSSVLMKDSGRKVLVPQQFEGVTYWTFSVICGEALGPADYITLASTFHTIILEDVPILTVSQKNEARRFITLLDALYEARCKLIIRAEAGPDDIFFPEFQGIQASDKTNAEKNNDGDAVYPETLSEIYQDKTSPFRPNISSYTKELKGSYDLDEDSNFVPILGKENEPRYGVDFGVTSSFTGEDERFAYKRASSRLWEMCGARWHSRSDAGWWKPLPLDVRRWERSSSITTLPTKSEPLVKGDARLGGSVELYKPAGLQREEEKKILSYDSPFREMRVSSPKIAWSHAWGMMKWGKKAGSWGQGPEGLEQKKRDGGGEKD